MSKYIGITLALVAGLFGSTSSALAGVEEDKSAALAECGRLKELRTWADKDCTDDAQFKDDAAKAACEAKKAEALKLGDAAKLDELCKKVEVAAGACDNCDKDKKGAKGGVTAPGAKANEKSADPAVSKAPGKQCKSIKSRCWSEGQLEAGICVENRASGYARCKASGGEVDTIKIKWACREKVACIPRTASFVARKGVLLELLQTIADEDPDTKEEIAKLMHEIVAAKVQAQIDAALEPVWEKVNAHDARFEKHEVRFSTIERILEKAGLLPAKKAAGPDEIGDIMNPSPAPPLPAPPAPPSPPEPVTTTTATAATSDRTAWGHFDTNILFKAPFGRAANLIGGKLRMGTLIRMNEDYQLLAAGDIGVVHASNDELKLDASFAYLAATLGVQRKFADGRIAISAAALFDAVVRQDGPKLLGSEDSTNVLEWCGGAELQGKVYAVKDVLFFNLGIAPQGCQTTVHKNEDGGKVSAATVAAFRLRLTLGLGVDL